MLTWFRTPVRFEVKCFIAAQPDNLSCTTIGHDASLVTTGLLGGCDKASLNLGQMMINVSADNQRNDDFHPVASS